MKLGLGLSQSCPQPLVCPCSNTLALCDAILCSAKFLNLFLEILAVSEFASDSEDQTKGRSLHKVIGVISTYSRTVHRETERELSFGFSNVACGVINDDGQILG